MLSTIWNVDQIARFNFDREHRARFGMNMENATTCHRESDFVLRVRVLLVELGQHCVQIGSFAIYIDNVRSYVRVVYEKFHVHSRTEAVVKYLRA